MPDEEQSFSEAFSEATGDTSTVEAKADPAPSVEEPAPVSEPDPTPAEVTPEPSSEPTPVEGESGEEDYKSLYLKEKHRYDSFHGKVTADKVRRAQEEALANQARQNAAKSAQPAPDAFAGFDDEDKRTLTRFCNEHADVAAATLSGPKAKTWAKIILDKGFDEAAAIYDASVSAVAPIRADINQNHTLQQAKTHFTAIADAHPDWVQVIGNDNPAYQGDIYGPKLKAWVGNLPYAQGAEVVRILQKGSSGEIIRLVTEFKKHLAGAKAPAPTPTPSPADPAKRQAAKAVTNRGQTSIPRGKADPNDFSAAWKEFTG